MLDPRAQHLLKTLVERYIADGQPVGSRALSRHSGLELSPATIRNVMADLEEMGFIASPHTSAGPRADAQGLPVLRRQPDGREAARAGRDPPARRGAARRPPAAARQRRRVAAVAAHAVRRRRDDAQAARGGVPAPRVPAPVRAARAADHRHRRRRRAEPHPAHRPRVHASRSSSRRRNFFNQTLRRPAVRRRSAGGSPTSCTRCARTSSA